MTNHKLDRFRQVTVALNTPYDQEGNVSVEQTKALVQYYHKKGIRNLYVAGSTGEGFLLKTDERKLLTEAVMVDLPADMTVIVHVGAAGTKEAVELAKHAEQVGAHATAAVPCVYYRPSEEGIYQHWMAITEATNLPFFIYNIPQLTGYNLSNQLFLRMIEHPLVLGVKNSSEPVADILRFRSLVQKEFLIFNGPDEQYLSGRLAGADAGIGGTYGAMPELYLCLESLIRAGRIAEAQQLQVEITKLIVRLCSFPSMYGACKTIIRLDGCDIGDPRLPFLPVSDTDPRILALHQDIRETVANWQAVVSA